MRAERSLRRMAGWRFMFYWLVGWWFGWDGNETDERMERIDVDINCYAHWSQSSNLKTKNFVPKLSFLSPL